MGRGVVLKKMVVTGAAGFIGSNFVRYQLKKYRKIEITIFDKLTYAGNRSTMADLLKNDRCKFVKGDIADAKAVRRVMKGCDSIVNFAAGSHVDRSLIEGSSFIQTNVTGVYNILEAAKEFGTKRVLQVSTDEVYGSKKKGSFTEKHVLSPRNPYSAAKAGGELMAKAYFETFKVPVIITRGSNTYGPWQYPEKVLPLFVTRATDNDYVPIYGKGLNRREWLYVDDHCSGIDCALRKGTLGEVYNVSSEHERKNIQLTHKILDTMEKPRDLIKQVTDREGHDFRYSIDCSKLEKLGWEAKMDWDEGMEYTINWYKENESWWRKITKTPGYQQYIKEMERKWNGSKT